jgi:hypothetical protein
LDIAKAEVWWLVSVAADSDEAWLLLVLRLDNLISMAASSAEAWLLLMLRLCGLLSAAADSDEAGTETW